MLKRLVLAIVLVGGAAGEALQPAPAAPKAPVPIKK
jgi:hypothetical protein